MKRLALFFSIIIAITATTWVLKAQQRPPEKKYSVSLTLNNWVQITQQLEFIKGQLRQSDLPSKQVAYLSDSLLTPMQSLIGYQVNQQLDLEKAFQQKKDTITKPKKQ
jgi:hypothetical protein